MGTQARKASSVNAVTRPMQASRAAGSSAANRRRQPESCRTRTLGRSGAGPTAGDPPSPTQMPRPDQMLALMRAPISLAGQPECLQLMLNAPGACSCSACAPGPMTPAHQHRPTSEQRRAGTGQASGRRRAGAPRAAALQGSDGRLAQCRGARSKIANSRLSGKFWVKFIRGISG